jgi:crossover junction endodeoxyribonuclease RusA
VTPTVCFDVPALPGSVNDWRRGSGHWSIAAKMRERMRTFVALAIAQQRPDAIPGPVHVALTFYWPTRRRRDPDNGAKHVLDAIVDAGLIEDDGPPTLVSLTLAARYDAERPRTEVRITAAGAPAWVVPTKKKRRIV